MNKKLKNFLHILWIIFCDSQQAEIFRKEKGE